LGGRRPVGVAFHAMTNQVKDIRDICKVRKTQYSYLVIKRVRFLETLKLIHWGLGWAVGMETQICTKKEI
jgi:hypothetical protein